MKDLLSSATRAIVVVPDIYNGTALIYNQTYSDAGERSFFERRRMVWWGRCF